MPIPKPSGSRVTGARREIWKTQKPTDYIDTSLVINTWETVVSDLSNGAPARLWFIIVEQTNNGATAEDIELEITINGTAYTFSASMASGARHSGTFGIGLTATDFTTSLPAGVYAVGSFGQGAEDLAIPFTADKVGLIRVRQTSTVDVTSAQIEVNIIWDKLGA